MSNEIIHTEGAKIDSLTEFINLNYVKQLEGITPTGEIILYADEPPIQNILLEETSENAGNIIRQSIINAIAIHKSKGNTLEKIKLIPEYKNVKIKYDDVIETTMHSIDPSTMESKKIQFNCVVNGLDEKKTYYKEAGFLCDGCGDSSIVKPNDLYQTDVPFCKRCKKNMKFDNKYNDYTESIRHVLIEEPMEEAVFSSPQRYTAIVKGDLTSGIATGQHKLCTAIFKSVPILGKNMQFNNIVLDVLNMVDMDERKEDLPTEEEIKVLKDKALSPTFLNDVVESITTAVGLYDIKLSVLLSLAKGCSTPIIKRDDIHVYLMGNPSTFKSELLEFAHGITPRSRLSSGDSTGKVGIRGGIVTLPDGSPMFVAGTMSMANGSHLFIDELDKIPKDDLSALYRAMEQQTIKYDKVIHVETPADTSIIASANPKNGYMDKSLTLQQNFNIPFALQTRFDLIWFIPSIESEETNTKIAEQATDINFLWVPFLDRVLLIKYLNYIRKLKPVLTQEAGKLINKFWVKAKMASIKQKDGIKIEPRHLHGLIRLAFAFAKLQFHERVTLEDAQFAVGIFTRSLASIGQDVETGETKQAILFGKKENKQHTFMEAVNRLASKNDDRIIEPDELVAELIKDNVYDVYNAQQKIKAEASSGETIITTFDGKLKLSE